MAEDSSPTCAKPKTGVGRRVDVVAVALLLAVICFACMEYHHALYARYMSDEFLESAWGGDLAGGERAYVDFVPVKTQLGPLVYAIPYRFFDRAEPILLLSRHIGFAWALLALLLVFGLTRALWGETRAALWVVFWTLACTTFLERSFRIRVDMMSTCLALLAVYSFIALPFLRGAAAAGVLLSLAFCTTQKSVFFIVAFVVSYAVATRHSGQKRARGFGLFAACGVVTFALYVLEFVRGGHYGSVLAATFASEDAVRSVVENPYSNLSKYYLQTLSRNPVFYFLSFAGLGLTLLGRPPLPWRHKFLACFTLTMVVCLIAHQKSWPYVFVMVIPFLACHAGAVSHRFACWIACGRKWIAAPVVALLVVVAALAVVRYREHERVLNFPQLETIRLCEDVLGSEDAYYDGLRMVGTRKSASRRALVRLHLNPLVAAWDEEGPHLIQQLRRAECKVIISNYRLKQLPDPFWEFVRSHYVLLDCNVFVAASEIDASSGETDLVWGGEYGIVVEGQVSELHIDGRPIDLAEPEIQLAAGSHAVAFAGEGSVLLIPRNVGEWKRTHTGRRRLYPLFPFFFIL